MDYFDSAYFDGSYFDVEESVPTPSTPTSGGAARRRPRLYPRPTEVEEAPDTDWIHILL